jgi:homoserine dehydrogenase
LVRDEGAGQRLQEKIVALKFGSSVLRSPADLSSAVHEIYRWYRTGARVVAVVSAIGSATDELLNSAWRISPAPEPDALAGLLATGEPQAPALLTIALDAVGVRAKDVDPREMGVLALGPVLDSHPVGLDAERALASLLKTAVLVVPGFFAYDERRQLRLLGRGGSDLSAMFPARFLRAARCRLLKDVDGVYEADPATVMKHPRRYISPGYAQALEVAGQLIQAKAVEFLDRARATAEVAAPGLGYASTVDSAPQVFGITLRLSLKRRRAVTQRPTAAFCHDNKTYCRFVEAGDIAREVGRTGNAVASKELLVRGADGCRQGGARVQAGCWNRPGGVLL